MSAVENVHISADHYAAAGRGVIMDNLVVRLADEGLPIMALVRTVKKTREQVIQIIDNAVRDGRLVERPASDWPAGSRRAERLPAVAIVRTEDTEDLVIYLRGIFGVTHSQAKILALLLRRGRAPRNAIHEVVSPEADPKIIDVFICKLRARLALFQISIKTLWGYGYELPDEARADIICRLREEPNIEKAMLEL